jgi:hypothetical protein
MRNGTHQIGSKKSNIPQSFLADYLSDRKGVFQEIILIVDSAFGRAGASG